MDDITPSVRRLELHVESEGFEFDPGQWVDVFLPGVDTVGGFSICSTPFELPRVTLGVKRAAHPPARWCHERAAAGDVIRMRPGGSFMHAARPDADTHDVVLDVPHARQLLLVAGGVGINPLVSILRDFVHALARAPAGPPRDPVRAKVLFSAPSRAEFPFYDDLRALAGSAEAAGRVEVLRTLTGDDPGWTERRGRIDASWLAEAVARGGAGQPRDTLAFLCGPPPMTEALAADLARLGVPEDQVRFEKWW